MHALCRRPDVEVEAILTHYRRRLTQHRHTNLHTGRGKRIRVTRPSSRVRQARAAAPQVAGRRGSEWDAFVDSQSAVVYSGYRAAESVNTSWATSVNVQTTLQKLNAKASHAEDFMS